MANTPVLVIVRRPDDPAGRPQVTQCATYAAGIAAAERAIAAGATRAVVANVVTSLEPCP